MGLLTSLQTGVTGLAAQGEALATIGDNISNASTTGFKASRTEFQDIFSAGSKTGSGVRIGAVNPVLLQGNIEATEKVTDLALSGEGYFVLKTGGAEAFSRDGSFHFDKEGYLVNNDGNRVQGFEADGNGKITNKTGDIKFPSALTPAKPTKELAMELNLDSRIDTVKQFNVQDPYGTSHFSSGVEVFDSQGNKHLMTMFFNRTADRQWEVHGLVDGKEMVGGKPGVMQEAYAGKLSFTTDGKLDTETTTKQAFNFTGGALQNQQIKFDFGDSMTTDKGKAIGGTKHFGKDSDVITWRQDGSAAGMISNISFTDEGVLTAVYSNGKSVEVGQVAIAKFENPTNLQKLGGNKFKESRESGSAAIGKPGMSGRGKVFAKSLERSTVDLAQEFVNLMQNQRGFQANAKTITTTDELLGEVIQLKR